MKTYSGHCVDVVSQRIFDADIIIEDGKIKDIVPNGSLGDDAPYLMPGFIDSHMHVESTQLLPENLAKLAVTQGTVGIVNDPHEIANVLGTEGIDFMVRNSRKVRFHFSFGVPSCVPSTCFETAGAAITAKDVENLVGKEEFYGLAEMMNYPGVLAGDSEVLAKIDCTLKKGKVVDGHAPGLDSAGVRRYIEAGITTDHEMFDLSQARERLDLGMKILIREGSAGCNFEALYPLLTEDRYRGMLMLCSDDIYVTDFRKGHVNALVARAVSLGVPLWNALHAACVAPVKHYKMKTGLLQKGDGADMILVDNLRDFNVLETVIDGHVVFKDGLTTDGILTSEAGESGDFPNRFSALALKEEDIRVKPRTGRMQVITAINKELLTGIRIVKPTVGPDGYVISDPGRDILKMVVYNRYCKALPAVAFISGFGIKSGAIAASITHDSHNIIAIGTSDTFITRAINTIVQNKGGMVSLNEEKTVSVPLPVAGLMSDLPAEELELSLTGIFRHIESMGCTMRAPLMTMSFMALPVIPQLKLTDKGLFDVNTFKFTDLFV